MAERQTQVVLQLREMILNGELAPGEILTETPLAERFGVSRTPLRHALTVLEREGLLTKSDSRSYAVRRFQEAEIADAIEVRAVLEGLAGRLVAEHGLTRGLQRDLRACLVEGEDIMRAIAAHAGARVPEELRLRYFTMNERFHRGLVEASGNAALLAALALNDNVPFASANAGSFHKSALNDEPSRYMFAHMQHCLVVEALEAGESTRVEALLREHAQVSKRNMNLMIDEPIGVDPVREHKFGLIAGASAGRSGPQ